MLQRSNQGQVIVLGEAVFEHEDEPEPEHDYCDTPVRPNPYIILEG